MQPNEKLSMHFTYREGIQSQTADRKKIDNTPSPEILEVMKATAWQMDLVRAMLGHPIVVSSWYRCPALNKAVGGAKNSDHMLGRAVDFTCPTFGSTREVVKYLKATNLQYDQLILEFADSPTGGWVHISFSPIPRRQTLIIDHNGTRSF